MVITHDLANPPTPVLNPTTPTVEVLRMKPRNLCAYQGAFVVPSYESNPPPVPGVITSVRHSDFCGHPVATVVYNGQSTVESLHLLTVVGWWRPVTPAC